MATHSSFQSLGSRWVALQSEPKGVIQFIGGAFFGTPPSVAYFLGAIFSYFPTLPLVSYHFLLENLLKAGYSIALVPYLLTVNHWPVARQLLAEQQKFPTNILKVAENLGYVTSPYQDPDHYLWIGHSLGCEYITLLRFLSLQSQPSGNPEQLDSLFGIENQPALLIAPCFQPPTWLKPYKRPTQALARQLLVETARRAATAMISFNQDFTAGNLTSQTGDVYWIHQQLANNSADGLVLHQELSGNHYQPVGYDRGDRDLLNHVINCLEGLKMRQSQEGTNQSLPISSNP
ncbi:MAG: DUF1350 family protein [Pleurocapsa sp. MO_226.B13]|nr:DUF1350 family protein [Pleurocapsa sp. MO_226.B13]